MKKAFWVLLGANLVFFAVMQGGWIGSADQEIQVQPELNQDMIRMLETSGPAASGVMPIPVSSVEAVSAAVQAPPARSSALKAASSVSAPAASTAPGGFVCLEWGDFSGPVLTRATEVLSSWKLGDKLAQTQVEHDIAYWVYIPPLQNKSAVNSKLAELARLGIDDYFVVQGEGQWHNAISLGMFKTKQGAENFLAGLRAKGVRTAKTGPRSSKLKATVFRFNGVDDATEKRLTELQKDYAGSELKRVPCALTRPP